MCTQAIALAHCASIRTYTYNLSVYSIYIYYWYIPVTQDCCSVTILDDLAVTSWVIVFPDLHVPCPSKRNFAATLYTHRYKGGLWELYLFFQSVYWRTSITMKSPLLAGLSPTQAVWRKTWSLSKMEGAPLKEAPAWPWLKPGTCYSLYYW